METNEAPQPDGAPTPERDSSTTRWVVGAVLVIALAAGAVSYYNARHRQNQPAPSTTAAQSGATSSNAACPAEAKAAKLDFTMKDVSGNDVSLSTFKGKVILLDFWATWCGPCKIEIPWFTEFYDRYKSQGLQVVGISVDDTQAQLEPYVKQMKMNYLVLQGLGHDDVQDAFGPILGIPVTVVISRDGKICASHAGLTDKEAFEKEIKALL